jgi:hypothetical protein
MVGGVRQRRKGDADFLSEGRGEWLLPQLPSYVSLRIIKLAAFNLIISFHIVSRTITMASQESESQHGTKTSIPDAVGLEKAASATPNENIESKTPDLQPKTQESALELEKPPAQNAPLVEAEEVVLDSSVHIEPKASDTITMPAEEKDLAPAPAQATTDTSHALAAPVSNAVPDPEEDDLDDLDGR